MPPRFGLSTPKSNPSEAKILGDADPQVVHIVGWQNIQNTMVHVGGLFTTEFASNSAINGGSTDAGGRTFISISVGTRMRQPGFVKQVKVSVLAAGNPVVAEQKIKFKVFRSVGSDYVYIGETEKFDVPSTGVITFTFANPIPVITGDMIGFWLSYGGGAGNQIRINTKTGGTLRYISGDVLATLASASTSSSSTTIDIEVLSTSPYLAVTGDSIVEGHNTDTMYHSYYDNGPSGNRDAEIMWTLRNKVALSLQYQNLALNGQTFNWVATTGIVACNPLLSKKILIHCGVNDVNTDRSWNSIESNLNTIKAAITHGQELLLDEILPWNNGDDAHAIVLRTYNANLANWCNSNGATLVKCHDEMGQIRPSTGELDDIISTYNQDGVHLTPTGVHALAAIWKRYL